MGFFAGELEAVLRAHVTHPNNSPWAILTRIKVHPQQIDRLKKAQEDIEQVATLHVSYLQQLRQEFDLNPAEWARLQAGLEADSFLRLLIYHNYPIDDAINHANAIFAEVLKDLLATGRKTDDIYVQATISAESQGSPKTTRSLVSRRAQSVRRPLQRNNRRQVSTEESES
jgi:GAF domain-containing protein